MGFFSSTPKFVQNPHAAAVGNQYRDWGSGQTLGIAGKTAKKGLKQFASGNYEGGIVGNLLSPLRDQYATMQRESNRAYGMGALGLAGGVQPGLMARQKQLGEDRIGEQMGIAYGQALPGIYSSLSNTFQDAQNSRRQAELAGMGGQLAAANSGQWYQPPSFMDKMLQLGQLGMQAAGMATGFGGLGSMASTPYASGVGRSGSGAAANAWR